MPRALQAKLARETDQKAVLCSSTTLFVCITSLICASFFFSTRTREMAPNVPDKGSPSCRGVSDQKYFCSASADPPLPSSSRARQMRLPTSYKPALTHRSNPMPPRPRSLLMSTPVHPPSPDAAAAKATDTTIQARSRAAPIARAAISPLHPPSSPSRRRHRPTADPSPGRPKLPFFPSGPRSSTDAAAGPREPSPTRSAASQPPPSTAAATEARVSLWAELKDIRRRSRTPATPALTT